jgi:putative ABC transport system permease protein
MWDITWRNVQFRRRQYFLAVLGTALVFALALLVTGVGQGFRTAAERSLRALGGDVWVVRADSTGPFTTPAYIPAGIAEAVADQPGVRRADPILLSRQTVTNGDRLVNVNVVGYRPGGFGRPELAEGREPRTDSEAVVEESLDVDIGHDVRMGPGSFRVVGFVESHGPAKGVTTAHITLDALSALAFDGRAAASAVIVAGAPRSLPEGYSVMTRAELREDLLRPLSSADSSINITRILLWIVAAVIVGAVMYMSALERIRDFAVFKAVGALSRTLVVALAAEAVITCLTAAVLAVVVAYLLRPLFPVPITVPLSAYAALPVVAVTVGVLASLSGIRRAVQTDPSLAFAGA